MTDWQNRPWKRVEQVGNSTLYLGDCIDVMREFEAESVDMIWTDPPYGHSNHSGDWNARLNEKRGIESKPIANDDADGMRFVVDGMLKEAVRVLKHDCCCCCCGGGPKPTFAWVADRMDREGLSFFHSVIWDKANPGLGWRYRRQHEMIMIAHRSGGKLAWSNDKRAVRNIFTLMPPRDRVHPNEKPLGLMGHFIELHTLPGQVVLDPFMGSGSTGVAAIRAGRRFIGIELDENHFETSVERVRREQAEPSMFTTSSKPKPDQIDMLGEAS